MDDSRRNFLKVAGCSLLGAAWGVPIVRAVSKSFTTEAAPEALRAKQWAMVVDLKSCERDDIRAAAAEACHREHNVPSIKDVEDEVKWIWSEDYAHTFPTEMHTYTDVALRKKPVLVLCNHCERPPCVRVCPTQATWRRADGIVMMDMHRCIGCRYCMVACPYGSRSFNFKEPWSTEERKKLSSDFPTRCKGVVEKCNFCAERLALGKPPACVEAVRQLPDAEEALVFGDLGDSSSQVSMLLRTRHGIRRKPNLGTGPQVYYLV